MGEEEELPLREEVLRQLERTKWFLWHGNVFQALNVLTAIHLDLELASWERHDDKIGKLVAGAKLNDYKYITYADMQYG